MFVYRVRCTYHYIRIFLFSTKICYFFSQQNWLAAIKENENKNSENIWTHLILWWWWCACVIYNAWCLLFVATLTHIYKWMKTHCIYRKRMKLMTETFVTELNLFHTHFHSTLLCGAQWTRTYEKHAKQRSSHSLSQSVIQSNSAWCCVLCLWDMSHWVTRAIGRFESNSAARCLFMRCVSAAVTDSMWKPIRRNAHTSHRFTMFLMIIIHEEAKRFMAQRHALPSYIKFPLPAAYFQLFWFRECFVCDLLYNAL